MKVVFVLIALALLAFSGFRLLTVEDLSTTSQGVYMLITVIGGAILGIGFSRRYLRGRSK